jgi:hypothetical protein
MATSNGKTLDYSDLIGDPDYLAMEIANKWITWKGARSSWEQEREELRNFIFATDTQTTSNSSLPWKNKTTRPKLTQIRDNLHANYMAAIFPHEDWMEWEPADEDAADAEKAKAITAYMKTKLNQDNFLAVASQLLYDYIDNGNVFVEAVYVNDIVPSVDPNEPDTIRYVGPRAVRISPFNIVLNVEAGSFHQTEKITRSVLSVGELMKMREEIKGATGWIDEAIGKAFEARQTALGYGQLNKDPKIANGISMDGFGNIYDYYVSGTVEVLEFTGDIYDIEGDKLHKNSRVIVIDRAFVVYNGPYDNWLGRDNKEHVAWRERPDNLFGMGPLDNLVGMQYRIDHLENLKADVFDLIAQPPILHKGEVEDWDFGPNARIYCAEDADVRYLAPDVTALNADMQIQDLERSMEEMAGAPRQAMGIRTPGEKTKFEVQTLENNTGRIFHHKARLFSVQLLEPLLNQMLAAAVQSMNDVEVVRIVDNDTGVAEFLRITKEDLQARGKLVPKGAHNFARKAQILQNLNGLANSAIYADPAVNVHFSGKKTAKLVEELLELDKGSGIVEEYIRIAEQMEAQERTQAAQSEVAMLQQVDTSGAEAIEEIDEDLEGQDF